jgi:hypothetical protein
MSEVNASDRVMSREEVEQRIRALRSYKFCDAGLTPAEAREFDALTTALFYMVVPRDRKANR